jgi:ABC-2 type transport system permease protein
VITVLLKLWAFIKRDFLITVSYRFAFLLQIVGMLLALMVFFFVAKMIDPDTKGLNGVDPFSWILFGYMFQFYFSTALFAFSAKIRSEQMLGTLEAMLVSPTPTPMVIFSSAAWDFTYGAFRLLVYLIFAVLIFGVQLHMNSVGAFLIGVVLTQLSFAGVGILSASFILYFKRGDPINFVLSGASALLGNVFFPAALLPTSLRTASEFLPITWSLNIVRGSLLEGKRFSELQGDLASLALMTAILLPAGLVCSRFAIRRAKREGSLIKY